MIASIQKIIDVRKADNADSLDVVKVLGWQVVTRMGEFKPGDTVVYVEIDSVLPELEVFEFMRNKDFRVKTAKFRGNLSQGIVFPMNILPPGQYDIGVEVDTLLGITHYEKPIPVSMQGMMRGNLPFGLSKTDEERYQNVPGVIEEFQGKEVYITTKIDGCLDENTIIDTIDGPKTIKHLCEMEYRGQVKTYDLIHMKEKYVDVSNTFIRDHVDDWYAVELENGTTLNLTGNHMIWIDNLKCWRRVDELDGTEEVLVA